MAMTWIIQSTDLRRRVREVLERVHMRREAVIVQSYERPQAVLIPYEEFEEFNEWRAHRQERAAWLAELQRIAEEVSARAALSEEEAAALIDEAIQDTRSP
jgi:prevent-host-death family protein